MLDPVIWVSMLFTLIFFMMIGGFILAFPLVRRLADYMELRLREKGSEHLVPEVEELRSAVRRLEEQVHVLSERHEFVEGLLGTDRPAALRRGDTGEAPADRE